jgi:hypothetical protein
MSEKLLIPLAAGGVALYYVTKGDDEATAAGNTNAITKQPATDWGLPAAVVKTGKLPKVNTANNSGLFNKPATGMLDSIGLKQYADQMETELIAGAKEKFDQLSSDAKKTGAAILNDELKLNPPLKGDESFKEVSARVGAVAGGAAGAAACGAVSFGAAAPLCGIAGAYLGQKLGPVVGKYAKKAVLKPAKAVGKAAKKVYKKLKFW